MPIASTSQHGTRSPNLPHTMIQTCEACEHCRVYVSDTRTTQTNIDRQQRKRANARYQSNPSSHMRSTENPNPIKPQPKAPYSQTKPAHLNQNTTISAYPLSHTSLTTPPPVQFSYSYYPQPCNKTWPPVPAGNKSPLSNNQAGGQVTPCLAAR
jgi:hypothetical protein